MKLLICQLLQKLYVVFQKEGKCKANTPHCNLDEKKEALTGLEESFIKPKVPSLKLFVPGRACLFGEHSDWAGSYRKINHNINPGQCIVCGTNQGLYAKVQPHPTKLIMTSVDNKNKRLGPFEVDMNCDTLRKLATEGDVFSYVAGVAYQILSRHKVGGLIIDNYHTTLPLQKGLSSSAAVCVLVARAFNKVYDLKLTIEGEMDYAFMGERTTPSQCGRMDQCCAFGMQPVLMQFDGDYAKCKSLNVQKPIHLVIVDLGKSKNTHRILSDLNACFGNVSKDDSNYEVAIGVQKLLGEINLNITNRAIESIEKGEVEKVGALMTEAQQEFDYYAIPACPSELSSPYLHKLLKDEKIAAHIFGGKGVGSQGDGSAQFICKSVEDQEKVVKIIENEWKMECVQLTIGSNRTVKKAVIPAASYASDLFPASKAVSTALWPIVDSIDGLAKPAILILVEEAVSAGIEEVFIIVSQHELSSFEQLFHAHIPIEQYHKLSPQLQKYSQRIIELGRHVTFIVQQHLEGLGHAVFQAKKFIESGPFLLMLGDHLYRSKLKDKSCVQQLLEEYKGVNLIGLHETNPTNVHHYGTVAGTWNRNTDHNREQKSSLFKRLHITEIVEKPSLEYAKKHLKVDNVSNDNFLTAFGLYILDGGRLLEIIGDDIECNRRKNGRFQLTTALETLRIEQDLQGYMIDGVRFDIGASPQSYVQTLSDFSSPHLSTESKS
ncbi:nucleotidyl transferase family protein [Reticulomyxa filosa]|uniref:UTP--glucose-1-phosphate uridylyltransferase n=1 Tax=Reticulomyxa filosa TaxID=46433 RepID=X6MNA2_RETFI|nr:nucleotidyl transferase family protein [Reticulomyxa filosa]|eukprot:ETO14585.1 nucleotidyl transferase family protein [Reticulomyxa filosa]